MLERIKIFYKIKIRRKAIYSDIQVVVPEMLDVSFGRGKREHS